jgi:hypothetical protein
MNTDFGVTVVPLDRHAEAFHLSRKAGTALI